MTQNVIQVQMPEKLAVDIQRLVKKGLYKNRSEVVIDAVRHFLGGTRTGNIASQIEERLIGKTEDISYNKEEMDELWERVRQGRQWKKRFGGSADEVMTTLRSGR